jgi:hypothetical protein
MHLLFILNRLTKGLLGCLNLYLLFCLFQISLSLKLLACGFLLMQILLEIVLDSGVVNLNPPSKSLSCWGFEHIGESSLKKSFLLIEVACLIYPCVETASDLHVSGSRDKISHNFFAKTLHLWDRMHLNSMCDFNWTFDIFNLVLMLGLSPFQLIDVFNVNILSESCHCLLPSCHSIKLFVSVNTLLSSIKKLFTHFEWSDKHQPWLPDIFSCHLLPLSFEPVALLFNEFFPSCVSTLLSEFNEIVPEPVSINSFCSNAHTSLQLIES